MEPESKGKIKCRILPILIFFGSLCSETLSVFFLEGVWCKIRYGKWETHSVAIWGAFNIVYEIGIPVFYIGSIFVSNFHWFVIFVVMSLLGSIVEYLCGMVIRIGIRMKAWDYSKQFLNIQGLISLKMAVVWGVLGLGFSLFLFEPLQAILSYITGFWWTIASIVLTVFMTVNFSLTAFCIIRWANRHKGKAAANKLSKWLDQYYPDSKMQKKFFYWHFLDEKKDCFGYAIRNTKALYDKHK